MPHFPVNHPARPIYRVLAGLVGLYILVFGVWGTAQTLGDPLFDRGDNWVLGLRTNLAFSLASVIFGIVLIIGASRRGNLGHYMNLTAGVVFLVTSLLMMSVLQTEANFLNFSMSTVIVSMLFGLLLLGTGLYDKVGTDEHAEEERRHRHHPVSEAHGR
jgi:membrane protein insertase Oxa1/YidC/SpoIIIJ